jgi:hypothetical protein
MCAGYFRTLNVQYRDKKQENISKDFLPRITRMGTDIGRQRVSFEGFDIWFFIREISAASPGKRSLADMRRRDNPWLIFLGCGFPAFDRIGWRNAMPG